MFLKPLNFLMIFFLIHIGLSKQTTRAYSHKVAKKVWLFKNESNTLFQKLNLLNTKHFAEAQNYSIHEINHQTYVKHLPKEKIQKIHIARASMVQHFQSQNRLQENSSQQLIQSITQRLIIYAILAEHGGVFIDRSVTLIQPLDNFLDFTVQKSDFVNGGHKIYDRAINYCIGFFNESFSSLSQNLNLLNHEGQKKNRWEYKSHITLYPNLEDYFIASTKGNLFIKNLFESYVEILMKGKQYLHSFNSNEKIVGSTNRYLIFQHGHYIAMHCVLQKAQQAFSEPSPRNLAVNSLGYIAINSRLGPTKVKTQFALDDYKIFQYLTKLTIPQMQLAIGKLHSLFMFNLPVQQLIQVKLLSFETATQFWVQNSFAHQFWIKHIKSHKKQLEFREIWKTVSTFRIIKNSLASENKISSSKTVQNTWLSPLHKITFDLNKPKWQSLQKNIWIIWDNGVKGKSNLVVQLCYENLKRSAQNSGFNLHAVSRNTIQDYLSKQMIDIIEKAVKNVSFDLSRQAVSDLWRMALIYEKGGVYFDASTFTTEQSFDWIIKIPQIQQNLIWNRYDKQPQVFMLWNTYYGCPLQWEYDEQNKTKMQWHLSYENNFIVAKKGSKLIKQWLDTMLQWIQLPYMQTEKKMAEAGIIEHKWTWDSKWSFQAGRYLTAMDSLKYIMGKRQALIKEQKQNSKFKNSAHYYNLWSMPGQFLGQQKLRGQTNYEQIDNRLSGYYKSYNTIYKYQYPLSYVEQILGPIGFQGKFFSRQLSFMNKAVNDFYLSHKEQFIMEKLYELIHPQSLLARTLFNPNPSKTLQLIKHYSSHSEMQRNFKGLSKVWTY